MTLTILPVPVPLHQDEDGAVRVGNTRVLLDVIVEDYNNGADAETIARDCSVLNVADVYAVLSFYLLNREQVDAYVKERRQEAEKLREKIEAGQPDRAEFRKKLGERRANREETHAASGE